MGKSEVERSKVSSKTKKEKSFFSTKVVIRRLPPSLKEEKLKECLGSIPEYDFFYFVDGQLNVGPILFSRAYINFKNPDDIIKFRDEFDGYVFTDDRGQAYPAVVEYAPYQGIPKKKNRKDPKCGTIEQDKDYVAFLASLEKEAEPLPSIEAHLEELESRKEKLEKKSTPLLEYLKIKRSSRGGSRLGIGKKRHEKEEPPKKNLPPNMDSKSNTPKEEKRKELKKADNHDTGHRDQNRKDDDKRQARVSKDSFSEKDSKPQRHQRDREGKIRVDSSRPNSRTDDRRENRRDRREPFDPSKGRDERSRRYTDRYSDSDRRRDNRPSSQRDFRGSSREENTARSKDKEVKETKEEGTKTKKLTSKTDPDKKDQSTSRGSSEKAIRDQAKDGETTKKRENEREKDLSRLKNKDRPDRAIYQPRPRQARTETDRQEKGKETVPREKDQDSRRKESREREVKDKNSDRNRDRERERRYERERDRDRDKERNKARDKERSRDQDKADRRERDRDRERERVRRKDRDRRERDRAPKEQKNNEEGTSNPAKETH